MTNLRLSAYSIQELKEYIGRRERDRETSIERDIHLRWQILSTSCTFMTTLGGH